MKCVNRSRASAEEQETSSELKKSLSQSSSSCISVQLTSDPKGPHNKENQKGKPCSVDVPSDDEVLLSSFDPAEDSGYLSLHNSQVESCIEEPECRVSPVHSESNSNCLPILKFQVEVCRQLTEGFRRSQSYDWTVIGKLAENYGLHNIIGTKMGLDYVDILCDLLKKDMKHILTMILGLLGDCDLINCKKVSKTWQRIVHQDKNAIQRCRKAEEVLMDTRRSSGSLSRDFCLTRVVFSCMQSVASTPVHKATKSHSKADSTPKTAKMSHYDEFVEAAKSLKGDETLRSCGRCGSPARVDHGMERAVCTRASCAFDFCVMCKSVYHGSSPCQRGVIKSSRCQSVPVSGSTRSKRSIRRL